MKYLLALLMLIAPPAWADWVFFMKDTNGVSFFLDFESLRKEGNLRKIWIKMELPVVNEYGWASVRQRAEFDCKEERKSVLAGNAFSKPNFEGKILFEASKGAAQDIAPQSVDWNLLKIVCRK
jgi:hypothetical protein